MYKIEEDMAVFMIIKGMSYVFKICLAWLGTLVVFQNLDYEFFKMLTEGTPSLVAQWLGFLYLIFIVVRKGIDTWERWRIAKYNVNERKRKSEKKLNK